MFLEGTSDEKNIKNKTVRKDVLWIEEWLTDDDYDDDDGGERQRFGL
jgi:hypothetical protein